MYNSAKFFAHLLKAIETYHITSDLFSTNKKFNAFIDKPQ